MKLLVALCLVTATALAGDPSSLLPDPPLDVWGVRYCGNAVLWVVTAEGNVRRFDEGHKAPLPPEEFQAWIESAKNSDIVDLNCPTST